MVFLFLVKYKLFQKLMNYRGGFGARRYKRTSRGLYFI